jgi:hypothetical protein
VFRLAVGIVLLVGHGFVVAVPARPLAQLPIGEYVRVSRSPSFPSGGRETGNLQLLESSKARAKFRLEMTMNPWETTTACLRATESSRMERS